MDMLTLSHVAKNFGEKQVLRDVSFAVPEFYPYMTPTEYLRFCGEISGMSVKEIKSRSEELLRLVGLEKEKHRIKGFSRGMKQRLGVAQALFSRPKLLICDEPTSALDPAGRKELLDILTAAKEETTVLFSTHILSDVEHICDEMAFLNEGKIALKGSLDEVRKLRKESAVTVELEHQEETIILRQAFPFLKTKGKNLLLLEEPERLAELLYFIADKKLGIMRIERQEATLSDLFMEVVGK